MPTGLTRREIRRMVLARIGDLTITTATAPSGSAQWVDTVALTGEAGQWAGRELLVTGGTPENIGQVRAITGSNRQATIQFSQALPADVAVGDEAEIINTRGGGFRFQQVHAAIDSCLVEANVQVPVVADVTDPFDRTTRTVTIPDTFNEIFGVQYQSVTGSGTEGWLNVKRAKTLGDDGWAVDHATRTVTVGGGTGSGLDGATVRLHGLGRVPLPVHDDDVVAVDPSWITYAASAFLLLNAIGGARSMTPEWERKGSLFQQEADRLIDRTRPRRKPNSVKV